jgi:hypothetical protein
VTDYDCWHPDHDSVTVDLIIAIPAAEWRATAQKTDSRGRLTAERARVAARARDALADERSITRAGTRFSQIQTNAGPLPPNYVGKYMAPSTGIIRIYETRRPGTRLAYDLLACRFRGNLPSTPAGYTFHRGKPQSSLVDSMEQATRWAVRRTLAYTLALPWRAADPDGATAGEDFERVSQLARSGLARRGQRQK